LRKLSFGLVGELFVGGGRRGGVAADGNEFGDDADGDFFGGERADFEAHRRIDALKFFGAIAALLERFVDREHFALAADHADVACVGAHGPGEDAHVFFVAAGNDDEIAGGIRLNFREGVFVGSVNFQRHWETLAISERFAVVNDADGEADIGSGFGDGHRNVAAAKKIEHGLRKNRFDENFERAAADEAVVVGGFVVEIEDHFAWCFVVHHFFGCGPDFGFDAAAADGAGDGAIVAYEHARGFVGWDRAVGVDDGGEGGTAPGAAKLDDFFEEVHGSAQRFSVRRVVRRVNAGTSRISVTRFDSEAEFGLLDSIQPKCPTLSRLLEGLCRRRNLGTHLSLEYKGLRSPRMILESA